MFVTEFFDSALRGISAADYRVVEGTDPQSAMYLWRQMDGFLLGDSSFRPLQDRIAMTGKLTEFYLYAQSMLDMGSTWLATWGTVLQYPRDTCCLPPFSDVHTSNCHGSYVPHRLGKE
ncbi:uncharacterized protein LOC135388785 [Ornithodoros turicata]|uniref:uncharacterized protein LOC135388785 n=1 Tax=Ornithodoros turicata TaxID=34597 RepID=UPI00313987C1